MTLCSLLAGFIMTSWTNTDLTQFERNVGSRVAGDIYFVTSAVSIALSIYCLTQSILCTVYAFGLALRGPLGSMVIAVDGIIQEKPLIIGSYFLAVLFFALSTVAFFWATQTSILAIATTVIMTIGMCFWYYYSIRIVNRFRWTDDCVAWDDISGSDYFGDGRILPSSSSACSAEGFLSLKDISFSKDDENPWVR
jgi:hypothetical protein